MEKKFKRGGHGKEKPDPKGKVAVRIFMVDPKQTRTPIKGQLSKSMTIDDAKVSDVYEAITEALF